MDDQDVDDLFDEEDMLLDSSQESLTTAAANFQFGNDDDDDQDMDHLLSTPGTGAHGQDPTDIRGDRNSTNSMSESTAVTPSESYPVIKQIETVFERIADGLTNENTLISILLKIRPTSATPHAKDAASAPTKTKEICFPGRTAREAWRFSRSAIESIRGPVTDSDVAVVIRILELMHEALRSDVVLSKR